MLVRNVSPDDVTKSVLITATLEVVQLHDLHHQSAELARYKISWCAHQPETLRVQEKIQHEVSAQIEWIDCVGTVRELVLAGINPDILDWIRISEFKYKTLPKYLRSTKYTVEEERHMDNVNRVLCGLRPPRGLMTLINDHRLNVDWYDIITYHDIESIPGQIVRATIKRRHDDEGNVKPSNTSWIVYFGDNSTTMINHRSQYDVLSLKHAIRAVSITHNTLVTPATPWLEIKVYNRVMS